MNEHKLSFALALLFGLGLALALVWLLGRTGPVHAGPVERYVAPGGVDDANDCTTPGAPCATVQRAVDAANPGDMLLVAGGTYTGVLSRPKPDGYFGGPSAVAQLVYVTKTLTIRGGYSENLSDWNPAVYITTLDAEQDGRGILIGESATVTLQTLRVTGGDASGQGGGFPFFDAGGGVYVVSAQATLSACQITTNTASLGGGAYILDNANAVLADNIFSNNTGDYGGGLALDSSVGTVLSGNSFFGNAASSTGGAGYVWNSISVTLDANVIFSNSAPFKGGGLYLDGCYNATLSSNEIYSNTSGDGGGVYLNDSNVATLNHNAILHNTAHNGGGVCASASHSATLDSNVILSNTATINGGGVYLYQDANIRFENNVINANQAGFGGGLYVAGSTAYLWHTTLARDGNAIHVTNDDGGVTSSVALTNTILVHHVVGGVNVSAGSAATLDGVLWYGNARNITGTAIVVTNDITGAPAFADDGYHLSFASAARDAGQETALDTDLDGDPRPLEDGPDLGADEVGVRLFPSQAGSALPGQAAVYTHTLFSHASAAQSFELAALSSAGYSLTLTPSATADLAALGGSAVFSLSVQVAQEALSGTLDTSLVTATGSLGGLGVVQDATTTLFDAAAPSLTPGRAASALPGDWTVYTHTLTNHANFTQTFDLAAFSSQGYALDLTPSSARDLPPFGGSATLTLAVQTSGDALSDTLDTSLITATGSLAGRATSSDATTALFNSAAPSLSPGQGHSLLPGARVFYTHTLTNHANAAQSFDLAAVSSAGLTITLTPTTSRLAAWGGSAVLSLSLQAPADALSGTLDNTTISALGSLGGQASLQDVSRVLFNAAAPTLAPDRATGILPGDLAVYTHTLTNRANAAQTFALSTTSSQGWEVQLYAPEYPSATLALPRALAPLESAVISVAVHAPGDAISGVVDLTTITATGSLTGQVALNDSSSVLFNQALPTLSPGQAASIPPGGQATYTHTLTNQANAALTFELEVASSAGYTVTLATTTVELAAWGGSALLSLTVQAPLDPWGELVDTSVLTATAPPGLQATASDTTTVVWWKVYLPLATRQ